MKDDQIPATKSDILRLEERLERMSTSIDQVLNVLVNVDKRLTASVENHERRIQRLENLVGVNAA